MHKIMEFLLAKIPPTTCIDFKATTNACISLEGHSLAYIYTGVYILFFYEPTDRNEISSGDFSLQDWIETMQKYLCQVKEDTFGW